MSCVQRMPKICEGRSSWDFVLSAPTIPELELVEQMFVAELIVGETYMGPRWPVYLIRWTETVETDDEEWIDAPLGRQRDEPRTAPGGQRDN